MRDGFYALIQWWPYPEREEGRNVGVVLVEHGELMFRTLRAEGLLVLRIWRDLGCNPIGIGHDDLTPDLESFLRRLRGIPRSVTEQGLRDFKASESGTIRMMSFHSCAIDDGTMDSLFDKLVCPR